METLPKIIVVSGLPRSGTSLMMKMLSAGGIGLFVDHRREPDYHNPRGYYEYEKVKSLKKDSSWLEGVEGKAIKIVSMLLYHLPPIYSYKIIFMLRNMREIVVSQNKMLGRPDAAIFQECDASISKKFDAHLKKVHKWLQVQPNMECEYLNYNEVMKSPTTHLKKIARFLDDPLEINAMASVIDPSLYRNKNIRENESSGI